MQGEYSEHLYDEERKLRIQAENKCSDCPFARHTQVAIINQPAEKQDEVESCWRLSPAFSSRT